MDSSRGLSGVRVAFPRRPILSVQGQTGGTVPVRRAARGRGGSREMPITGSEIAARGICHPCFGLARVDAVSGAGSGFSAIRVTHRTFITPNSSVGSARAAVRMT